MTAKQKFDPAAESKRWMLYVVFVIALSWLSLWGLIHLPVTEVTTKLFFVALFVAITSTMMPPLAYLNTRFGKIQERRVYLFRFVRQSIWVGACLDVMAWLQMRRALSVLLAVILISVFVLIETFLITREHPPED
jgi:hypothetical protein